MSDDRTSIRPAPKLVSTALKAVSPTGFDQKAFSKTMDGLANEYGEWLDWHEGGQMTNPTRAGALRVVEEEIKGAQYQIQRAQQLLSKLNALKRTVG